ncbi:putative nucleotidyltransferase component of viral defense system [Flavobacterium arsenatis]|uniref:Nucleotidyltransferase component of viral defense system n=1 Tax=Flavobacterium arsenatis TaxID=1484332 RepID=A0ABU1TQE8_9FLAO|nr:nucleotidyl transferase AbiEii/AbiGii toxin family protein [Flavobacterium arsenatis]MDR6968192.1 putative nucleotidyltransferase component of viral defense system [Flavobacterium arsenatis]
MAGGTNLALRYNHRISDDIDLFCPEIIGFEGFNKIIEEVKDFFGKNARNFDFPCDINDQYCFLRFFVDAEDGTMIKVEMLQNMKHLFAVETINNIRLFNKADIGLYKLISLANRSTKKDVYDLDFITEEIKIVSLYENLVEKVNKFNQEKHRTIFDLDKNESVLENPELLIRFDNTINSPRFPAHTHDNINIAKDSKTWIEARINWRSKVRQLYTYLGKDFPGPKGIDIS